MTGADAAEGDAVEGDAAEGNAVEDDEAEEDAVDHDADHGVALDRQRLVGSLLWGVVGVLVLLVLVQGYRLFVGAEIGLAVAAGAVLVVGVTTTVGAYLLDAFLAQTNERA